MIWMEAGWFLPNPRVTLSDDDDDYDDFSDSTASMGVESKSNPSVLMHRLLKNSNEGKGGSENEESQPEGAVVIYQEESRQSPADLY